MKIRYCIKGEGKLLRRWKIGIRFLMIVNVRLLKGSFKVMNKEERWMSGWKKRNRNEEWGKINRGLE